MPVTTFPRDTRYPEPLCRRCGLVWTSNPTGYCHGCRQDYGEWALNHARARAMRALGLPHAWARPMASCGHQRHARGFGCTRSGCPNDDRQFEHEHQQAMAAARERAGHG